MKFTPDRRQFLRGAGGAALVLPFLPSLAGKAHAQVRAPKRFVYIGTMHDGVEPDNMFATTATTASEIWAGSTARQGALQARAEGADAVLSPVLRAPASVLTARMVGKLNVMRGIDYPQAFMHQEGCHLGNNARFVGSDLSLGDRVTIDQVMAYSPSFYRTGDGMRVRSIHTGDPGGNRLAWTYQNPTARTGVQPVPAVMASLPLFDKLFAGSVDPAPVSARRKIIDRVIENYRRLRDGDRRLSSDDRVRVEAHIARLTELESTLTVAQPISCGSPARPRDTLAMNGLAGDFTARRDFNQVLADLIAAAVACGVSRIATMSVSDMVQVAGSWHQDVAHQSSSPEPQKLLVQHSQRVFEHVFLHLANRLDAVQDADGRSVLDNTLLVWSQECGTSNGAHSPIGIPVITAGGAGGALKTGKLVDYRNQVPGSQYTASNHAPIVGGFAGVLYPQFLATALHAMGIARSEWETAQPSGVKGYGNYKPNAEPIATRMSATTYANASEPLPFLT